MPDDTTPTEPEPIESEEPAPDAEPEPEAESSVPEVPEDITEVGEETLRALHADLSEYRAAARERQDVDAVRQTFAEQTRISEELNRRRAEAQRVMNELAELDALDEPALPEPEPALAGAGASAAQMASVRGTQSPALQAPPPPAPARRRVALVAAAGTDVVTAGAEMDYAALGQAIDRAKRGREGTAILASIPAFETDPEGLPTLLSEHNGTTLNDELIREAQADWKERVDGTPALTASARQGAICQPFDIIREIPDAFNSSTPVADLFPSRPSGRGGWQFTVSGTLSDVAGAVRIWTEANQAAVNPADSGTWKPCIDYVCPPTQTAVVEAITECVQFPLTLEMSNPERVRNLNNALAALSARTKEGRILQRIDQLSHAFVFSGDYGALPVFIEAVNSLLPQLNWWNRLEPGRYDMIVPPGAIEVLRIDRAARGYGAEMEANDVLDYLTANIDVRRVVQALDPSAGGEPGIFADPLPGLGNQFAAGSIPFISGAAYRIRLVDASAAIYAESGEINAGVLRDANLIRQNRTGYFTEQFFMLEKNGPQPWATIDLELCADGARAGLIAPNGCLKS